MKKISIVIAMIILAIGLTACGTGKQETVTGDIQTGDVKATTEQVKTGDAQAEVGTVETGNSTVASINDDSIKKMLDSTLNWSGVLFNYKPVDFASLTLQEAIPMVGHAIAESELNSPTGIPYDEMTGVYTIDKETLDEWTMDYFGKTYESAELDSDGIYGNTMVVRDENGGITVGVGDWGLSAPVYDIKEMTQNEDGTYHVSVDYSQVNYEENIKSEPKYHIEYLLEENKDSKFGFIISDMIGTQF